MLKVFNIFLTIKWLHQRGNNNDHISFWRKKGILGLVNFSWSGTCQNIMLGNYIFCYWLSCSIIITLLLTS